MTSGYSQDLSDAGGVNGRVAVTTRPMGGDPAVGADKSLRILARNRRNEQREFSYKEGGFVKWRMFEVRRDHDDRDERFRIAATEIGMTGVTVAGTTAIRTGLRIIRAYYGIQG